MEKRPPLHLCIIAIEKEPSGHSRLRSPTIYIYICIYIYRVDLGERERNRKIEGAERQKKEQILRQGMQKGQIRE